MRHIAKILGVASVLLALSAACSSERPAPGSVRGNEMYRAFLRVDTPGEPSAQCGSTCQQFRREFRYVVYVGKQIYCYWNEKKAETGTDFDALAKSLEQQILEDFSFTDYYAILRRWAAAFHDGHVNVMAGDQLHQLQVYSAPVSLEVLAPATDHERVIVTDVKGPAPISAGDEVLLIDGKPVREALDAVETTVSGSTKRMRRFFGTRRLVDALGVGSASTPLVLTVLHKGEKVEAQFQRSVSLVLPPASQSDGEEETGLSLIKAAVLPGAIGYLRIDGFSGSQDRYLLGAAMDRLISTRALVIDVRRNGGGDQSGNEVISRFIENSVTRYSTSARMSPMMLAWRPEYIERPWDESELFSGWTAREVKAAAPALRYLGKPVVVLTGPNCFSACDTFTSALKSHRLAVITGEGTGGGTGTPQVFDLPSSGLSFRYSVERGKTALEDPIEGVGTLPDLLIEPTVEERLAGRDLQLAKAIDVARKSLGASGGTALVDAPRLETRVLVSPTIDDELSLRRIALIDELER